MSSQKWVSPAISSLVTTQTAAGPADGTALGIIQQTFASAGEINIGSSYRVILHGTVTTTGTPTVLVRATVNGFTAVVEETGTTASGVTDRSWRIEYVETYRGLTGAFPEFGYSLSIRGLFATDQLYSGVLNESTLANPSTTIDVTVRWDQTANDADSGDVLTVHGGIAEWVG